MKVITIFRDEVNRTQVILVCEVNGAETKVDHLYVGDIRETAEDQYLSACRLVGAANVKIHLTTEWEPHYQVVNSLPEECWGDGPQREKV